MYRQRSSKCKAFCIKIKPYTRFYKAHDEYIKKKKKKKKKKNIVSSVL